MLYAHYKNLDYFSTECTYSPEAYRGYARAHLKTLESLRPSSILDIIKSGEDIVPEVGAKLPKKRRCSRCGYLSSNELCKACILLQKLNQGLPRVVIAETSLAQPEPRMPEPRTAVPPPSLQW